MGDTIFRSMNSSTSVNPFSWEDASASDEDALLALMEIFYAEEGLVFELAAARAALRVVLTRVEIGRVMVMRDTNGGADGAILGYLVLTFGFSLEFHGRYVLLDELHVIREFRDRGCGRAGIEAAASWARAQGVRALRLEVNETNQHAREVYLRRGFKDDARRLLTRWV
jgi:ribosomal protein S18 acetylase RimI-like enzyme